MLSINVVRTGFPPRALASAIVAKPAPRAAMASLAAMTILAAAALLAAVALLAAWALLASPAFADGFVVVRPVPELPDPIQLAVRNHDVHIAIRDQVGHVEIDQTFRNLNGRQVEGEYLFPVPDGAAVSDFTLWVEGQPVHAQAMDAEEALRIYEGLVRESRDPALLEYAGREVFRARIFPFPPHGDRRVALEYDQIVERQGGLYRFVYPLSTEKFSSRPLEHAFVSIILEADRPVRNAYCPTHDAVIEYLDGRRVRLTFEENGTRPDRDLVFFYSLAEDAMDIRLVPYRPDSGDDGYFMLLASVGADQRIPVLPKDVVFVIDQSGSMEGTKMEQAREALAHCLRHLDGNDRFNVIAFANSADLFADRLQPASRRNVDDALDFVRRLESGGGTNIEEALQAALDSHFDRERPAFVVFVTDGLPTVGETDPQRILEELGHAGARIFPFGVGYDVNSVFLDQLAVEHGGSPSYVRPTEDLHQRIAGFYDQIAQPVMTDLRLEAHGLRLRDLEPGAIPDLFRGSQLVLFGRYSGSGPVEISLIGRSAGKHLSFEYDGSLPRFDNDNVFVGRLWATRRIGSLLRHIRLYGEERELVDEIKDLGLRFGIASPYTSFLVDESEMPLADERFRGGRDQVAPSSDSRGRVARTIDRIFSGLRGGGSENMREGRSKNVSIELDPGTLEQPLSSKKPMAAQTGEIGFEMSRKVEDLASARFEEKDSGAIRSTAGRTFQRDGDLWRQLDCPADPQLERITVGSEEYFALLKAHPEIGAILALGNHVIFELEKVWYEIVPKP
ncbi:MAG: VIT domain-containing protein [Candidatus Eisenbacteria bacterium]